MLAKELPSGLRVCLCIAVGPPGAKVSGLARQLTERHSFLQVLLDNRFLEGSAVSIIFFLALNAGHAMFQVAKVVSANNNP